VVPYRLIDDFLPVLVVRREGPADVASVTEMLTWVRRQLEASPGKVGYVYDAGTSAGGLPDAAARRAGGEWIATHAGLIRKKAAGLDFAFASPLSRGALTAVFWISAPPVPSTIHARLDDAVRSAIARVGAKHAPSAIALTITGCVRRPWRRRS
jgi:hypothetical protein